MIEIETVTIPAGWGCDAFQIGKYPVTVAQRQCMGTDDDGAQ